MEAVKQKFSRRKQRIAERLGIEPPTSSFAFFKHDFRVVLQNRNEETNKHTDVTRHSLKKWKRMSAEEKKPYHEKSATDLKRFHDEKRAAEGRHSGEGKNAGINAGSGENAGSGDASDSASPASKPLRPIRPLTAFLTFSVDVAFQIAAKKLPRSKVLHIARGRWEEMKDSEKEPYHAQVFEEKDEHDEKVEEYSRECKRHGIEEEEDEEKHCHDEEEYSSCTLL